MEQQELETTTPPKVVLRLSPQVIIQLLIPISILTDSLDEATEQFTVTLTNPQNARAGSRLVGTVNINDSASTNPPVLSIADISVNEGAGSVALTVSVNPLSGQNIDVDYATVNGTALAVGDLCRRQ